MKQLFDAKLWIKRDLSHLIQKKKKKKKLTEVWHVKTVEKLQ